MLIKKREAVIVVGCGRFGATLAGALCAHGYQTVIIDKNGDSFRKLPESFSGYRITGDGTNCDTLESAGIKDTDLLIAATNNDNINSLIAQLSCRIYNVGRIFMRLNDSEKAQLVDGFNIEVICPLKLCLHEFENLSAIHFEGVTVYENCNCRWA